MYVDTSKYDFIDFGCYVGGSMNFAVKRLGGTSGLGIDRSEEFCAIAKKKGFDTICSNVQALTFTKKSVKFSVFSHFLEHLPSLSAAQRMLKKAADTSTDFIFVESPSFDFDTYLKNRGLKFFWSDGCGHHNLLQLHELKNIISTVNAHSYTVLLEQPFVKDSSSRDIHSVQSPFNVTYYDNCIHPPKPQVKFVKKVFRSFVVFIWLRPLTHGVRKELLSSRPKFKVALHKNIKKR